MCPHRNWLLLSATLKSNYGSFDGCYVIGSKAAAFETKWSKASNFSIHVYNDPFSINGVAIDRSASEIHEIRNAISLDYTSLVRTPNTGQIVVLRNENGLYAALKLLLIKDDKRGDDADELQFIYAIQTDGSDSFECFMKF